MNQSSRESKKTSSNIWHLRPSPLLLSFLVGIYILGVFSVLILPLPWYGRLLVSLVLIAAFIAHAKEHASLTSPKSIMALSFADQNWQLIFKDAQLQTATLLSNSFVGQMLVLNFKTAIGRKTLIVPKDKLQPFQFHQLCLTIEQNCAPKT